MRAVKSRTNHEEDLEGIKNGLEDWEEWEDWTLRNDQTSTGQFHFSKLTLENASDPSLIHMKIEGRRRKVHSNLQDSIIIAVLLKLVLDLHCIS